MSTAYYKFLFINTVKRKPIWITWILFLFTVSAFLIFIPLVARINTLQLWANTTMIICQTLLGLIASVFTAVLAINIFKETNQEGTDLVVFSKPLPRIKIIIIKFLVFGTICLIINLCAVLITVFTIFLPRTEPQFYWGLLISMFIGNLIVFGLFGAIAILSSVSLGKIGVIVINIVISLVFLIYQVVSLFVIPTPTKNILDQGFAPATYIVQNRNTTTGTYTESEVVKFNTPEVSTGFNQFFINWQHMKKYWEEEVALAPSTALNVTDLGSQLALTYLSIGTDKYSDRYSQRMFGSSSRFYDYELISPASPEIVDPNIKNKQSLQFVYLNSRPASEDMIILPGKFAFIGISINSQTLRGLTNLLPIGSIKTKEFNSTKDVYFEKEDWKKYSKPFDIMFENCFRYDLKDTSGNNYYILPNLEDSEQILNLSKIFVSNNTNIKKMFELLWACFMGKTKEYIDNNDTFVEEMKEFSSAYFDIQNIFDLNSKLLQFKNYCFYKAYELQQDIINNGKYYNEIEQTAILKAVDEYNQFSNIFNIKPIANNQDIWKINYQDNKDPEDPTDIKIDIIEPNTQTINYHTLNTVYDILKKDMTIQDKIVQLTNSSKFKIDLAANIVTGFAKENETYLYSSLSTPERTADNSAKIYINSDDWITYIETCISSLYFPKGHNMQFFFYTTHRKVNPWWFIIIWSALTITLTGTGIIVYNKNDIK